MQGERKGQECRLETIVGGKISGVKKTGGGKESVTNKESRQNKHKILEGSETKGSMEKKALESTGGEENTLPNTQQAVGLETKKV